MLVIYESMYGNTRRIAEAVASELHCLALPVGTVDPETVNECDLVVLGAPTHVWRLSSPRTRQAAADGAGKPGSGLTLEPEAIGTGLREWLDGLSVRPRTVAVFDTRSHGPRWLTGSAAHSMRRVLRRKRVRTVVAPESFLVAKNRLLPGEEERARAWAADLASRTASATTTGATPTGRTSRSAATFGP